MKRLFRITIPYLDIFLSVVFIPIIVVSRVFFRIGGYRLPKTSRMVSQLANAINANQYYGYFEQRFRSAFEKNLQREKLKHIDLNFKIPEQLKFLNDIECFKGYKAPLELTEESYILFDTAKSISEIDLTFLFEFMKAIKPKRVVQVGGAVQAQVISEAFKLSLGESTKNPEHQIFSCAQIPQIVLPNLLNDGDLLFIDFLDSSISQSDILYLFLHVFPKLKRGVYVQINNIYLPYESINEWAGWGNPNWSEHKLLQSLLSDSKKYQVVASLNLLMREHQEDIIGLLSVSNFLTEPNSFYFKTT